MYPDDIPPLCLETESAWIGHIPLGIWIGHRLQPEVFVELGVQSGHSFFNIARGVFAANPSASCIAVDTWQGDPQTGEYGAGVYAQVKRINRQHFSDRCRLLKMTFDDALAEVADGSVGLLHIDGFHGYSSVRHDFETWLPKMTADGVILFHDICERGEGFGVWKLWDELKSAYPRTFEFPHSSGLGVLCLDGCAAAELDLLDRKTDAGRAMMALFQAEGGNLQKDFKLQVATAYRQEESRAYVAQISKQNEAIHHLQNELTLAQNTLREKSSIWEHARAERENQHRQILDQQTRMLKDHLESHKILVSYIASKPAGLPKGMAKRCIAFYAGKPSGPLSGIKKYFFRLCLSNKEIALYRLYAELQATDAFQPGYYLEQNTDVLLQGMDPLLHWLSSGCKEGRRPHPCFDPVWYLKTYEDVSRSGMNPFLHYLQRGAAEGRIPSETESHLSVNA